MHIVFMPNLTSTVKRTMVLPFPHIFLDISPKLAPILLDFSSPIQTSTSDEPMVNSCSTVSCGDIQFPLCTILLLYRSRTAWVKKFICCKWYFLRILWSLVFFTITVQCVDTETLTRLYEGVINCRVQNTID